MKIRYARLPNGPAIEMEGPLEELLPAVDHLMDRELAVLPAPIPVAALPPAPPPIAPPPAPERSEPVEEPREPRAAGKKKSRCPKCGELFPVRGLPIHQSKAHGISGTKHRPAPKAVAEPRKPKASPPSGDFACPKCDRQFSRQNGLTRHMNEAGHTPGTTEGESSEPDRSEPERSESDHEEGPKSAGRPLDPPSTENAETVVKLLFDHLEGSSPYQLGRNFQMKESTVSTLLDHAYRLCKAVPAPTGTPAFRRFWESKLDSAERLQFARRILQDKPDLLR